MQEPQSEPSVNPAVQAAAKQLLAAEESGTPCAPVRDGLPDGDIDVAYAVQAEVHRHHRGAGRRPVGHKIGLTAPSVQQQLGVDQPDSGLLYEDMGFEDGVMVPSSRLIQPKVEAEVGFVLAEDLDREVLSLHEITGAMAYATPALEIVDSRIRDWDIRIVDTIADNASSGLYVLGRQQVPVAELDLVGMGMALYADGEQVSEGTGQACMGNPLYAVQWLARTARRVGNPLRAGDVILSGALGPMVTVTAGVQYRAVLDGLGKVRTRFSMA